MTFTVNTMALIRLNNRLNHTFMCIKNSLRDSSAQSILLIYLYTIPLPMWFGDLFFLI